MANRSAVLIGVEDYQDNRLSQANYAVKKTLDELAVALLKTGYNAVERLGAGGRLYAADLREGIERAIERFRDSDVLFVYICGHGFSSRGDRLILRGLQPDRSSGYGDHSFSRRRFCQVLSNAHAGRVVVFMDTCREPVAALDELMEADADLGNASLGGNREIIWLYGCVAGSQSWFAPVSFITHLAEAMLEVIDPKHWAATLEEVCNCCNIRLCAICSQHGRTPVQELRAVPPEVDFAELGYGHSIYRTPICDHTPLRLTDIAGRPDAQRATFQYVEAGKEYSFILLDEGVFRPGGDGYLICVRAAARAPMGPKQREALLAEAIIES